MTTFFDVISEKSQSDQRFRLKINKIFDIFYFSRFVFFAL